MKVTCSLMITSFFIGFTLAGFCQGKEYRITDFGAIADGITNNSAIIQKAIDKASESGGGRVTIPPGNFATGVIVMKSNVELHLELGARLLGSVHRADYDDSIALALIAAKDQKNISISGSGVIDGQVAEFIKNLFLRLQDGTLNDPTWKTKRPSEHSRPKLIEFIGCDSVTVTDVKLMNPGAWMQNYYRCSNIVIDNLTIQSTAYWNNDGIDISDSKNVRITNCNIEAADDGICLKSETADGFCENIYISNCTIRSSASAFKLGTASHGGFRNVVVRDLTVYDTYRSAIALESVDGGTLENIDIQDVTARNAGNAIFIRLGHRNKEGKVGKLRDIHIANVRAEIPLRKPDLGYPLEGPPDYLRYRVKLNTEVIRPDLGYPQRGLPRWPYNLIPSSIVGIPGHYVEDVTLENIEIVFEGASDKALAHIELDSLHKVPEMESSYPEFSMFGELPAWGFYVRHASGVEMKNVKLSYRQTDFRPALVFDDARNILLDAVEITTGDKLPVIVFNNAENITTNRLKLPVENKDAIRRQ